MPLSNARSRTWSPVVKTGTFAIAETLHFTDGGQLKVGAAGITINITGGGFIMDANTLLDGNVTGCNTGAAIAVALTGGNVTLEPLSVVRSNSCSGGFIQITTGTRGTVNIDGLVESVGSTAAPARPEARRRPDRDQGRLRPGRQ